MGILWDAVCTKVVKIAYVIKYSPSSLQYNNIYKLAYYYMPCLAITSAIPIQIYFRYRCDKYNSLCGLLISLSLFSLSLFSLLSLSLFSLFSLSLSILDREIYILQKFPRIWYQRSNYRDVVKLHESCI